MKLRHEKIMQMLKKMKESTVRKLLFSGSLILVVLASFVTSASIMTLSRAKFLVEYKNQSWLRGVCVFIVVRGLSQIMTAGFDIWGIIFRISWIIVAKFTFTAVLMVMDFSLSAALVINRGKCCESGMNNCTEAFDRLFGIILVSFVLEILTVYLIGKYYLLLNPNSSEPDYHLTPITIGSNKIFVETPTDTLFPSLSMQQLAEIDYGYKTTRKSSVASSEGSYQGSTFGEKENQSLSILKNLKTFSDTAPPISVSNCENDKTVNISNIEESSVSKFREQLCTSDTEM